MRANGLVSNAQRFFRKKKFKQWLFLEKVEDNGYLGKIRRILYRYLIFIYKKRFEGILAIGEGATSWYFRRGFDKKIIYQFAYFMSDEISKITYTAKRPQKFRFIFVGQLISRKRVDFLIKALYLIQNKIDFELQIVGDGPLSKQLNIIGKRLLPNKINWLGSVPITNIPKIIAGADCLILPSRHDGWGSVISEALMVGTPVICSDSCGASTVVKASKFGGVFSTNNINKFSSLIMKTLKKGRISNYKRNKIRNWAKCLGAKEGSKYLLKILQHKNGLGSRPKPPWTRP